MMAACFLLFTAGCGQPERSHNMQPARDSIIGMVANPEKYNQRQVSVLGFLSLNQENYAVFLHAEDFRQAIYSNALWLHIPSERKEQYKAFNGKYCLVEGVFKSGDFGFGGFYAGAVDVTWIGDYVDVDTREGIERAESKQPHMLRLPDLAGK